MYGLMEFGVVMYEVYVVCYWFDDYGGDFFVVVGEGFV